MKNEKQWEWIKETLMGMKPVEGGYGLTLPGGDVTRLDMKIWKDDSADCGFAGCAIGHLVAFNPEQTLVLHPKNLEYLRITQVARYFGINQYHAAYAFFPKSGDDQDPGAVVQRMILVEEMTATLEDV